MIRWGKTYAGKVKSVVYLLLTLASFSVNGHGGHAGGGPRSVSLLDVRYPNISRALTAGYPDSFGLFSFWGRQPPEKLSVDGRTCQKTNFIALDIDDKYLYDANVELELTLRFAGGEVSQLVLAYDKSGSSGAYLPIDLSSQTDDVLQTVTLDLKDARFINRGIAGTDIAISSQETMFPAQTPLADTRFTLCDITMRVVKKQDKARPEKLSDVSILFQVQPSGDTTPVKFGLYDRNNRLMLPVSGLLSAPFYEYQRYIFSLRSGVPNERYWPSVNRNFMYSPGRVSFKLAPGVYRLIASKGPEYLSIEKTIRVPGEQYQSIIVPMEKVPFDVTQSWLSGDVHIHLERDQKNNPQVIQLMQAEGLGIGNLLSMSNLDRVHFKQPAWKDGGFWHQEQVTLVPGTESPRTAFRGHVLSLNVDSARHKTSDYLLYHKYLEFYAASGGISGYAHIGSEEFNGSWGLALDVPTGLVDFAEIMQNSQLRTGLWYEHLNIGHRLSPAAGSDFPYFDQPGAVRTLVAVEKQEQESAQAEAWMQGLKNGSVFVTNGPLVEAKLNGELPGSDIRSGRGGILSLSVAIDPGLDTLSYADIMYCGKAIKRIDLDGKSRFKSEIQLPELTSGWLAVYIKGHRFSQAHTGAFYLSDEKGESICRREFDTNINQMLEHLSALDAAEPDLSRELEYWSAHQLQDIFLQSRAELKKHIQKARNYYLKRRNQHADPTIPVEEF